MTKPMSVFDRYFSGEPIHVPEETKKGGEHRSCTKCKQTLPLAMFTIYKKGNAYYPKPRCKACLLEDKRVWRAKNRKNKGVVK